MRFVCLAGLLAALLGCGEDPDAYLAAEIGWTFNYRDWTEPRLEVVPDDFRGCDNVRQTSGAPGTPGYAPIAKVHLVMKDPEGLTEGIDEFYDCSAGEGDRRVRVAGIPRRVYELTLEAVTAEGIVLYRYEDPEYDVTQTVRTTHELRTVTGELRFFPRFAGVSFPSCPSDVSRVTYAFYLIEGGQPEAEASHEGSLAACVGDQVDELVIRQIPIFPRPGAHDNYATTDFRMVLEGVDATGQGQFCGINSRRPVRPGANNLLGDEALDVGACPVAP